METEFLFLHLDEKLEDKKTKKAKNIQPPAAIPSSFLCSTEASSCNDPKLKLQAAMSGFQASQSLAKSLQLV